jgi:hypothetical protein
MASRKRPEPRPAKFVPAVIPLSAAEQAALDFARREFLSWHQNNSNPWSNGSALVPAASHAMVQTFLSRGWGDVTTRLRLIMLARLGLRDADAALRRIILEYQSRRELMPTELASYDMEVKTFGLPAPWAGPKKSSRLLRDMLIMTTVMAVVDKFGLPRTKRSPLRRSACEIVAVALGSVGISIGHKGVEKIVDRCRGAWPVPGWSAHMWPAQESASPEN